MPTITITWKAFANDDPKRMKDFADAGKDPVTSKTIETEIGENLHPHSVCEMLFHSTNRYQGDLWDALQPLPEDRTHTAMCVGDDVTIDGRIFRCMDMGFAEVLECPNHEGNFDCNPFCRLCEGEQEVLDTGALRK